MLGFDYETYQIYFEKIIIPIATKYTSENYGVSIHPDARNLVWKNYVRFNRHCREEYMNNPCNLTDRHKFISCYICSILESNILLCDFSKVVDDDKILLLNERLAFAFGMTLLRAIIRGNADELNNQELKDKVKKAFEDELLFPKANHGDYKQNFLVQLFHTKKEHNYNILALADSLFWIENYNLVKNDLPEDVFKIRNKKEKE